MKFAADAVQVQMFGFCWGELVLSPSCAQIWNPL